MNQTLEENLRQEIIAAEKRGDKLLLDKDYWGATLEYQKVFEYYQNRDLCNTNLKNESPELNI